MPPAPSVRSQSSYWSRADTGERSPAVVNTATSSLKRQHWEAVPYSPPSVSEGTDSRTPTVLKSLTKHGEQTICI